MVQPKDCRERFREMEYLLAHRGGRGQSFVYELIFERGDSPSKPQIPGLIDVYDSNLTDSEGQLAGSKRGQNGGVTEGWRDVETRMNTAQMDFLPNTMKTALLWESVKIRS